jgi:hypothetical protein|tara:strand:- start:3245 stop:4306 length:1062 start_codon:yes stop_codon:yes gene_type:complete
MEQELTQLQNGLTRIKNKESKIYFLTQDTGGVASASVATTYQYVKYLREAGYTAEILYEKKDYKGVGEWLDSEYVELPHSSIEDGELKVGPADFVVVPELYGHVLEQITNMPCTKIMFSQAYDYILETLNPGFGWSNYGVTKCITTSDSQKEEIKKLFPAVVSTVITPSIPSYFKPSEKPKKPMIAIHTRDQRDTMKIIKSFYLQNPQFKWVTFRDMRGLSREEFAKNLGESCASIWVDRISSFGTFPLESMMCDTPCIGTLPIMKPEWLTEENGIWVFDESKIVEITAGFLKNWLEDSVPVKLHEKMKETTAKLSEEKERTEVTKFFGTLMTEKSTEFESAINKLTPVSENS